ncbi:acyl-CoA dehydrogenase [Lentisphaera profundi]|uniref:Acyl-coenzyme A dehydrogenase n=1 Tax=Lentisphaera profundi TaxID=1658616 RepID=A0ABY7VUY4_9BACT|nr:acyl-CoA dehydrogenase [Lentisphaera profundi]WDE97522.1 acyl-CoA dehydrogenase [Lentisphaera profundi]
MNYLANTSLYISIPLFVLILTVLAYRNFPGFFWVIAIALFVAGYTTSPLPLIIVLAISAIFIIPPIRTMLLSKPIMAFLGKIGLLPAISQTEREAIDAGTVWVEKEFFSGKPDFKRIFAQSYPSLNAEEQAFLDGPTEELCKMVSDYDIACRGDLTPETWAFIKKAGFLSMIIPKEYGGLAFSALAVSSVCSKLASHSSPLSITVMVPNSLGPGELLSHYGTQAQKDHYLPRLADGREIPCFGLTEPMAGSDAGSISSEAEIFKKEDGELYLRFNFKKRYITLAAVSTVIGLAFKLRDPQNFLGKGTELGITCALIPSDAPGIRLGRRHDPLGASFFNCPINGENVELPLEKHIIGGLDGVGIGWRMLMNCLSAGRAVTLPATSTGTSKMCNRAVGAYAKVRKQFGMSIGQFEGIQEAMCEVGAYNYMLEAARIYTCGGVDSGEKPSVVSALAKYHFTETVRKSINHAMDISGGSGISRGPKNIFANAYTSTPIAITVEGANILTRTMIIFGQGLIRCHPTAMDEVNAIENNDAKAFDKALWTHISFVVSNLTRAKLLTLTRGWLSPVPSGPFSKYLRRINWASALFATFADMAMGSYGGGLKRAERITGRFGDMLSWMYFACTIIRRYEHEGQKKEDLAHATWALDYCMENMSTAFDGILQNIQVPLLSPILRVVLRPFFRLNCFGSGPDDKTGRKIALAMMTPGEQRDRFSYGMYIPSFERPGLGQLEDAFVDLSKADVLLAKIKKSGVKAKHPTQMIKEGLENTSINEKDASFLTHTIHKCEDAIQVDEFNVDDYAATRSPSALT